MSDLAGPASHSSFCARVTIVREIPEPLHCLPRWRGLSLTPGWAANVSNMIGPGGGRMTRNPPEGLRRARGQNAPCDANSRSCLLFSIRDARWHAKCRAAHLGEHGDALTDLLLGWIGETKAHAALTMGVIRGPF